MLTQFRKHYPHASLISELVQIDRGKYIVRALVQVGGITIATGLAAADTVERAEDRARNRALAILEIDEAVVAHREVTSSETPETPKVESVKTIEPQTVVSQPLEKSDSLGERFADRAEFSLSQDKIELPEALPLQTNGVTSSQTTRAFAKSEESWEPASHESLTSDESEVHLGVRETATETPKPSDRSVASESPQLPLETAVSLPTPTPPSVPPTSPLDSMDVIEKTDVQLRRLSWTNEQGRNYLLQAYGKRSRHLLTDEELNDFLHYLESLPDPA
jgi:hypothetical protein